MQPRLLLTLNLLWSAIRNRPIGNGSDRKKYIAICRGKRDAMHLFARDHIRSFNSSSALQRSGQITRPGDQVNFCTRFNSRLGNRKSHFSGTSIRNTADWVDGFKCRTGRNQYPFST